MARIDDGFSTTISFESNASVLFYEKTVTPPGIEGGGEIDTTTMRNTAWRTKAAKQLKSLTNASITVAYDPEVYDDILEMIQINQEITITFPDASTLVFYGWIDTFAPGALTEGEQPTAEITIIPSNQDESGTETAPVYTD